MIEAGTLLINKINEMKALPEDCRKLGDIVSKLQPIFTALDGQLQKIEHRPIMESWRLCHGDFVESSY